MELPECPVCLQTYNEKDTIPRVLACGHSVCEACLVELPQRYPDTIRCPACTQLVKYPTQHGPSALPKNIDLLRLCLEHPSSSSSDDSQKSKQHSVNKGDDHSQFLCTRFWSDELYSTWRDWILPHDVISIESEFAGREGPGLGFVLRGRFGSTFPLKGQVCIQENQCLSLAPIVSLPPVNHSKFNFSYVARIMMCLEGMKEAQREELALILKASMKQNRICKVYGLWSDLVGGLLYLVCERHRGSFLEKFSELRNGFVGLAGDGLNRDGFVSFSMIGMSICEALIELHTEGLVAGYFGRSCFCSDELGGIYFDLNEALASGRKICRTLMDAISIGTSNTVKQEAICEYFLQNECLVSPELLFELLPKDTITPESGFTRYPIGYGSDVWSLACVLLQLLFGNALPRCTLEKNEEKKSFDISGSYICWVERVSSILEDKLGPEYLLLRQTLCKCLEINPGSRPDAVDVRKCIWEMLVKPQFDVLGTLDVALNRNSVYCCLILGELCQLSQECSKSQRECEFQDKDNGGWPDFVQDGEENSDEGLSKGMTELKDLRGHLDCITGLAVGGGYLFSSSFDKTVRVWSLQDFSHLHTFRGHENKVMALVYVDEEEPLCISGDSGAAIFMWGLTSPLGQDPLRKWYEQKDWRFSGIHAMIVSRNRCLYTGSGDRSIKAWSLKDGNLICTMDGHRAAVSTLAICDEVLYSGSWDGTIRLWSLIDHSLLTVLGEDVPGEIKSVLSITADRHLLVVAHENGRIKVWRNDVFMKSQTLHSGAIFAICIQGKCLYTGGWDKKVNIQELSGDDFQLVVNSIGDIPCSSVVTAILCWQEKLFVGFADKSIKVYHGNLKSFSWYASILAQVSEKCQ
ncbi:protein translocase subunit SECA2, chloroplastic isoform X2 [Senna tora]|uniref:Protein translocase subunit SECA2, chloroplastic isoform X2 n=1 Tax=Senna tora TaxID=362788 RepID=A0A834WBX4_9FABA|nr:protein translocase subunit SECA2, chloroplastic isoform X2 [Senna tora]